MQYWDEQEASYNGVLGGFGFVSDVDVKDSRAVLLKVSLPESMYDECTRNVGALHHLHLLSTVILRPV